MGGKPEDLHQLCWPHMSFRSTFVRQLSLPPAPSVPSWVPQRDSLLDSQCLWERGHAISSCGLVPSDCDIIKEQMLCDMTCSLSVMLGLKARPSAVALSLAHVICASPSLLWLSR
jgi:hypothetical protein